MHRVQQQLEDNCKNKLGGLPVKKTGSSPDKRGA